MTLVKLLGVCVLCLGLALPAYADRGSAAYKKGVRAERQGNLDAAFGFYNQAHALSPRNARYFMAYTETRFKAANEHVHNGQLLRNTGELEQALTEFQQAVGIDASSFIAHQELRLTEDLLRQREEQRAGPLIQPPLANLEPAEPIELQPISSDPIAFKMTGDTGTAYKALGKMAGLNVLFDADFRPQQIKIDLAKVTVLQALSMVGMQSKTSWRPIAANTIFVTGDAAGRRKDLEQNFMKTFYLQNVSSANELQEAAGVVAKILDVDRVQLLPSQDALILRGTMDQLVLAEKLLTDIDKPKSEVVIDVMVMEVDRERIRNLGTTLPTSTSVTYLPGSTPASSTSTTASAAGSVTVGKFSISVPGATLTALASDSNTKVLQSPQIRALNDEKATLRIGDRVPIASGSFSTGLVGGASISPLFSTQFQYIDVGVNIDIIPHIHANHQVTLRMSLEISSVAGENNIGGITEPVIGQRRIEHEARLADGEVNLLGGILQDTETTSLSGYPFVSKIPLLKYLFAEDNRDHQEYEIVFAITPHIVRGREVTKENARVIEVGTGSSTELRRRPSAPAAAPTTP